MAKATRGRAVTVARSKSATKNLQTVDGMRMRTNDSFANFISRVGMNTGNQNDGSHYAFNPLSRNRIQMEWAYRGSWIAGRIVDCVAKDMTREGVRLNTDADPTMVAKFEKDLASLQVWEQLCKTVQWARLYGGALAFIMIDGQNPATPLRLETVAKGQFKGLLPMDRWLVNPDLNILVEEYGPHFGKPSSYTTVPDTGGMPLMKVHYSRMIRIEGVELPYWQKIAENLWGQSVLERMWDRMVAFDSTTAGAAQLVYKAHLRTLSIEGLRDALGKNSPAVQAILKNVDMIRALQTNEGITLIDAKDKFEAHQYTFAGLDALLAAFGEQLAGATEIPLVRLFGQSPAGFQTGDADIRTYYDGIKQQQVSMLGSAVETLYRLAWISKFGSEPPDVFELEWEPLWQMTQEQKATVTTAVSTAVIAAFESGIIKRRTALEELKQLGKTTGTFTNVSDEEIAEAAEDPAPTPEALGLEMPAKLPPGGEGGEGGPPGKKPDDDTDGGKPSGKPAAAKSAATKDRGWFPVLRAWWRNLWHDNGWLTRHWDDAPNFDPNQPRKPKGSPGGGEWTSTGGGKLGSNPGGTYMHNGFKHYVKFYNDPKQGHSEVLAANVLNNHLGVGTTNPTNEIIGSKHAVASQWRTLNKVDWQHPSTVKNLNEVNKYQLAKMYYAAVLTKNWDTLGVDSSNIAMSSSGQLIQLDTGGSFEFRAQGKAKQYGEDVSELKTLLDPSLPSGKVFSALKKYSPQSFDLALKNIKEMDLTKISKTFEESKLPNKMQLLATFIKRREALLAAESGQAVPPTKAPVTPPKAAAKPVKELPKKAKFFQKKTSHQMIQHVMRESETASGPHASKLVKEIIKVPPPPLTPLTINAVNDYVNSSGGLNGSLRASKGAIPEHLKIEVAVLDEAISAARDYNIPIRVTRGIPQNVIAGLKKGETYTDHAYMSTSFTKQVAAAFNGTTCEMEIVMPRGFKFLSVPSFKAAATQAGKQFNSLGDSEAEALLPRGTVLKCANIKYENGKRVYYMKAIASSLQGPETEWLSTRTKEKRAKKAALTQAQPMAAQPAVPSAAGDYNPSTDYDEDDE